MISDLDFNDKKNCSVNVYDEIKIPQTSKSSRNVSAKSKINKIKRVTFKRNLVTVVKIESFKKYNADLVRSNNNNSANDKAKLNCTCIIM